MLKIIGKGKVSSLLSSSFSSTITHNYFTRNYFHINLLKRKEKTNSDRNEIQEKDEFNAIQEIKKLDLEELKKDKTFDYELFEKKKKVIDKTYDDLLQFAERNPYRLYWYEKLIVYPIVMIAAYFVANYLLEIAKEESPPFKRALERGERKRRKERKEIWEKIVEERNKIVEERLNSSSR